MHIELGVGNKAGKNEIDFHTCFEVSASFFGVSILIPSFGNLSPSFGSFSTVSVHAWTVVMLLARALKNAKQKKRGGTPKAYCSITYQLSLVQTAGMFGSLQAS